ncbi:MAG: iron-sulfur cluster assembly protein [Solirubrobacteraceae bacterium]
MSTRERVLEALDGVIDPELDEPITSLRFVSSVEVAPDGEVEVMLRLPTPQCAPNFAFLMAADAREAVHRLPGVRSVSVKLEDHYTGKEINAALGRGEGFTGAFPGETADDDLGALRELFQRKALVARQSKLCEKLLAGGATSGQVVARSLGELPDTPEVRRCIELRMQLGIANTPDAPAFVLPDGEPLAAEQLKRWLRMARLIRTSLEANGGICRSLLQVRHDLTREPEEVAR